MKTYDLNYLKEKEFFEKQRKIRDKYSSGKEIEYDFDPENKLAYFKEFDRDEITEIVKGLKKKRNFDYFWFWKEGRLAVFRRFGENKRFIFNLKYAKQGKPEYLKSKRKKLREFSPRNPSSLFDVKDVIDYFYSRLWEIRIKFARSIQNEIPDKEKILAAQRFIDRLIFTYFLGEKGIIKGKDKKGNYFQINFKELAVQVVKDSRDFFEWLKSLFFNFLNNTEENLMGIPGEEKYFLDIPYLNGEIFREKIITTVSGGEIGESELEIKDFEWEELVSGLNNYNWIIEPYDVTEDEDVVGNLTPEILGHLYEKFVITISKTPLDEIDIEKIKTTKKGELKSGRKKIGGYYTPEEITKYIAENTIFSLLKDKMNLEDFDNFDDFYKAHRNDKEKMKEVDEILSNIKVLDPAVGSGHFLMSTADLLADWRKKCGARITDYSLRKNITINNLYGVDIMEGAVEICKLRLWLWLIAGAKSGEVKPEPLPNTDYNFMVGNSLIGFIEPPEEEILGEGVVLRPKKVGQKTISHEKQMAFEYGKSAAQIMEERRRLIEKYKTTVKEAEDLKKKIEKRCAPLRENLNEKLLSQFRDFMDITDEEFEELKPFNWYFEFYEVFDSEKPAEEKGFEVVIGNPPHGASISENEKKIISEKFSLTERSKEIAKVFTERSHKLCNSSFGFVLPKASTYSYSWEDFREFVKPYLSRAIDLGRAFPDVKHEQAIIQLSTKKRDSYVAGKLCKSEIVEKSTVGKEMLDELEVIPMDVDKDEKKIISDLISYFPNFDRFEDLDFEIFRGEPRKYASKEGIRALKGKEVQPYFLINPLEFIKEENIRDSKKPFYDENKVVAQRIVAHIKKPSQHIQIASCFDPLGLVSFETVANIVPSKINPKVVSLLLNSKFLNWYVYRFIYNKAIRDMDFDNYFVKRIIIPKSLDENQEEALCYLYDINSFLQNFSIEEGHSEIEKEISEITNAVIYNLYLRKHFEKDGLNVDFVEKIFEEIDKIYYKKIIEFNLQDNLTEEEKEDKKAMIIENKEKIKKFAEKISSNKLIQDQMDKVRSHPFVKLIEDDF